MDSDVDERMGAIQERDEYVVLSKALYESRRREHDDSWNALLSKLRVRMTRVAETMVIKCSLWKFEEVWPNWRERLPWLHFTDETRIYHLDSSITNSAATTLMVFTLEDTRYFFWQTMIDWRGNTLVMAFPFTPETRETPALLLDFDPNANPTIYGTNPEWVKMYRKDDSYHLVPKEEWLFAQNAVEDWFRDCLARAVVLIPFDNNTNHLMN